MCIVQIIVLQHQTNSILPKLFSRTNTLKQILPGLKFDSFIYLLHYPRLFIGYQLVCHAYLIFVVFLPRPDNGPTCNGEWPSLAVISSLGHWNWFSSSWHVKSKYASCPGCPMSIWWHWKQIMWMLQLLGHSLWQHREEENVFRQFPSVLWYNLVQKHHLLWVTFWQIVLGLFEDMGNGGIHFPFTWEGWGSMCHIREYTRQDLSAHILVRVSPELLLVQS